MRRSYEIALYETTSVEAFVPKPGVFTYRDDRPHRWLQRLCLWTLNKLRCVYEPYETVGVERRVIRPVDFAELFFKADEEIYKNAGRRPRKIYVGGEDYGRIMGEAEAMRWFEFKTVMADGKTAFGVPVEVVPWMKGVLVV